MFDAVRFCFVVIIYENTQSSIDRHSALIDEREAYRELQSSFSQQLNSCNELIDDAEHRQRLAEEEAYKLRSNNIGEIRSIKEALMVLVKESTCDGNVGKRS